jgi:hypothetical protein
VERRAPLRRGKGPRRTAKTASPAAVVRAAAKLDEYALFSELIRFRSRGWCELGAPACSDTRHAAGDRPHHRKMRSQGGPNTIDNLLDVCPAGHRWVHDHPTASYAAGWLLHAGDPIEPLDATPRTP